MRIKDVAISTIVATSVPWASGDVIAQQRTLRDQLVGTWTLVSHKIISRDGTETALFGANPKGLLTFDEGGRYIQIQVRPDRPKFQANNRLQGTSEENKAALAGGIGQFGTWTVNDENKLLMLHEDGNITFPNEENTDVKRAISLGADDLKLLIELNDGGKIELVYRRAK
jgi:Lipocalin-like domain